MAHGDECHSKHHQHVGASSSGPSAKPKKLAKRPRPSSYREESSHEVSPPHGGTPDETEYLKMYSPEVHITQGIVNYSKEDPMNLMSSATSLATACLRRDSLMRDSGLSFIKIGIGLCFIQNHLQWSSSMLILSI
jgi:hypothetical protein